MWNDFLIAVRVWLRIADKIQEGHHPHMWNNFL